MATARRVPPQTTDQESRFIKSGGKIPGLEPGIPTRALSTGHFRRILADPSTDTWTSNKGTEKIEDLNDKHLVNIMRFLIQEIDTARAVHRQMILEVQALIRQSPLSFPAVIKRVHALKELSSFAHPARAVEFYSDVLPCFPTLSEEIQKRFGNRALRALYDGF